MTDLFRFMNKRRKKKLSYLCANLPKRINSMDRLTQSSTVLMQKLYSSATCCILP